MWGVLTLIEGFPPNTEHTVSCWTHALDLQSELVAPFSDIIVIYQETLGELPRSTRRLGRVLGDEASCFFDTLFLAVRRP